MRVLPSRIVRLSALLLIAGMATGVLAQTPEFIVVKETGPRDKRVATSPHAAGMNAALGDGSVRFLTVGISPTTWWAALTPAGGEVLGSDW